MTSCAGRVALLVAAVALAGCGSAPDATPSAAAPTPTPALTSATATPTATPPQTQTPTTPPTPTDWRTGPTVAGVDVSRYQGEVDWAGLAASGHAFAYVKATEGTGHRSPTHDEQAAGARAAGLYQGAYHYARPASSDGATQAAFFVAHGGAWHPDGRTLPGALDLEQATSGDPCHGLTADELAGWVADFAAEYERLTGRAPVVYVRADLWNRCLGDAPGPPGSPLWLYDHGDAPGDLPPGWERATFWQRAIEDDLDRDVFHGTADDLARFAAAPR